MCGMGQWERSCGMCSGRYIKREARPWYHSCVWDLADRGIMRTYYRTILAVALCVSVLSALVSTQITFSRDWTGGKRSVAPQLVDCGQFARLCRHFIHELKSSMGRGLPAEKPRRISDDAPTLYDDE